MLATGPALGTATTPTSLFEQRVLFVQNQERSTHGVEPLRWNAALAASARRRADHLALTGTLYHSAERSDRPVGENLWAGTRGYYPLEAMVDTWVGEKRFFKPGVFPNNSSTGRVADVGHYTQLMWRDTNEVGCALATGKAKDVLVCRYSNAGNYVGARPF